MKKIDLIIFRVPSDNLGRPMFVGLDYADGKLAAEGWTFGVGEHSSYNELEMNHIVLAYKIDGGSLDAIRYLLDDEQGEPREIHAIEGTALEEIVNAIVMDWYQQEVSSALDSPK